MLERGARDLRLVGIRQIGQTLEAPAIVLLEDGGDADGWRKDAAAAKERRPRT